MVVYVTNDNLPALHFCKDKDIPYLE